MNGKAAQRGYDHSRYHANPWRKWYSAAGWKSIRERRLKANPICQRCGPRGIVTPSTTVNHIKPHEGDRALFFSFANTEAVCKACHDRDIQREEHRGYSGEVGVDGWPVDPRHPVNQ